MLIYWHDIRAYISTFLHRNFDMILSKQRLTTRKRTQSDSLTVRILPVSKICCKEDSGCENVVEKSELA